MSHPHHARQTVYLATVPKNWTMPPVMLSAKTQVRNLTIRETLDSIHATKGGDR
jgi:hypothetical protein